MGMNVGELCSLDVVSAPAGASLATIGGLMRDEHVGMVVITKAPMDDKVAIGIITDRDLMRAQLDRSADFPRLRAEDIMTRDPLVLGEEDSIDAAIQRLRARGVRRAPVVSSHGQLVGVISTDELVAHVARELAGLAQLLAQQPRRERS